MRVLVTGANGFVGHALCQYLEGRGHVVTRAVRQAGAEGEVAVGDIGPETDWRPALAGHSTSPTGTEAMEAVVHLAAHVHRMPGGQDGGDPGFRMLNTLGTLNLARQAAAAGIKRLVFVSSIKVNGEATMPPGATPGALAGTCFSTDSPAAPEGEYARSKWQAEQGLMEIGHSTGLQVVILRPPLVYGPGVKANFLRLLDLAALGLPLPLGRMGNRRSLLYLGNLVDAIQICLTHPAAGNRTYLLADDEAISSAELVRRLARLLGKRCLLVPVPPRVLAVAAAWLGRSADFRRLSESLVVDARGIRDELNWHPPFSLDEGLSETVRWYLRQYRPGAR